MKARLARGLCRRVRPRPRDTEPGALGRRRKPAAVRDTHRVSSKVMAAILGVPEQYLKRLERAGVISRTGTSGTYDLIEVVRRWGELMSRCAGPVRPVQGAGALGTLRHRRPTEKSAQQTVRDESGPPEACGMTDSCVTWGDGSFDDVLEPLWQHHVNILRVPDHCAGFAAMGHFIEKALRAGERAVLVSFSHPGDALSELSRWGMEFESYLASEQLIYLYYKPNFSHSLSFATDYRGLLNEIARLANGEVSRVAFCNVDALFNVQSSYLATASIGKLLAVAGSLPATLAGYFVSAEDEPRSPLETACESLIPGYLVMHRHGVGRDCFYSLVNRTADGSGPLPIYLKLVEEHGFVDTGYASAEIAENTTAVI